MDQIIIPEEKKQLYVRNQKSEVLLGQRTTTDSSLQHQWTPPQLPLDGFRLLDFDNRVVLTLISRIQILVTTTDVIGRVMALNLPSGAPITRALSLKNVQ